jgi:enoyl-CoA hydratase/carnithine racemase
MTMILECEYASDGVAVITLNRPEARNALSAQLREALCEALCGLAGDDAVRAVVITGAAGHFCAGGDIRTMGETDPVALRERMNAMVRAASLVGSFPKPLIAAVPGHAAGAGVGLACLCDVVVAEESSTFTLSFLRIGLGPDWGVTHTVARRAGAAVIQRLLLTREGIKGPEALRLGIVDVLTAPGGALAAAMAQARNLAAGPPQGMAAVKQLTGDAPALRAALEREAALQLERFLSPEHAEGVAAFGDKRAPDFSRAS